MQSHSNRLLLLIAIILFMLPRRASADTESCTQAHVSGQRAEIAGQLKEALASFQECASDAACPLPIRNACTELYTTVEGRLPTVVFSVVDASGNDVVDVQVSSAEESIASGLDGRPIPVNPGLHEFRLQLPTGEVLTKSVVVRQGEKDRIVSVRLARDDLGSLAATAGAQLGPVATAPDQPSEGWHMPTGAWVSYGVGVAALGSWGTFALLGRNKEKGLVECSPNCESTERSDYDAMKKNYMIADISLGVAAAAVVTGTVILLTKGKPKPGTDRASTTLRSLSLSPSLVGREGGLLKVEGRF